MAKAVSYTHLIIGGPRLEEGGAKFGKIGGLNADTGIRDDEQQSVALRTQGQSDTTLGRGEFHRVGQQIDQNLLAGALVRQNFVDVGRVIADELDSALFGLQLDHIAAEVSQRTHSEGFREDFKAASLDLRHIENGVDHSQKVLALSLIHI